MHTKRGGGGVMLLPFLHDRLLTIPFSVPGDQPVDALGLIALNLRRRKNNSLLLIDLKGYTDKIVAG
jgi:hypothetical protein